MAAASGSAAATARISGGLHVGPATVCRLGHLTGRESHLRGRVTAACLIRGMSLGLRSSVPTAAAYTSSALATTRLGHQRGGGWLLKGSISRRTLAVVSADGRTRRVLLADPECSFRAPTWASRGTIAFGADCVGELQAIEPDGSGRRTLIKAAYAAAYSELMPSWSPNGRRLAFAGQNGMLRLANADGSHVRDVFRAPPGSDELPAWSPDGRRVAAVFSSTPPTHTTPELVASPVWEPAWSPDGHHLVGTLGEDYAFALVVVDLESGDERSITEHQGAALPAASAWSPDGRWIAFAWLYPAEGDQRASILFYDVARSVIVGQEGAIVGDHPSWSPDGSRLAVDTYFDDRHPERSSVFTVRRDGRQRRRLARNASQPAWSPDGRKIVFVRILGRSNSELFVMNADGSHQRRLTFNPGRDDAPDWQALPP